jgi:hypothetical protein
MLTILCPECKQSIEFDSDPKIGQQTTCQSCAREWVVTWLYPISLDALEVPEQDETDQERNAHFSR